MIDRRAMEDDFYKILGVSRSASQKEVQKAYRTLARKYHPDRVSDEEKEQAKTRFQKIQEAYDVLGDPEKRKLYDQFGSAYRQAGSAGGNPFEGFRGAPPGGEAFDFGDLFGAPGGRGGAGGGFEEILRQFTGGGGGGARGSRRAPRAGETIEAETTVPFRTAVLGGSIQLSVAKPTGNETLTVTIPAGIEDGKKIRLRGQGGAAPGGGPAGDLMLTVRVAPHPHFRRQGDNLSVTVPVTLAEAALGGSIDVPTPRGTLALKIPAGSSSGRKLRLKGQGIERSGQTGDLIVELQVTLPKEIDDESRRLIGELQRRFGQGNVRSDLNW